MRSGIRLSTAAGIASVEGRRLRVRGSLLSACTIDQPVLKGDEVAEARCWAIIAMLGRFQQILARGVTCAKSMSMEDRLSNRWHHHYQTQHRLGCSSKCRSEARGVGRLSWWGRISWKLTLSRLVWWRRRSEVRRIERIASWTMKTSFGKL
jgi:hypothetical protein